MSKLLFILALCFVLLTPALPAVADQYDDCVGGCSQGVPQCVEQARNSAGNIQEEQNSIAVCNKTKADCIHSCRDAEDPSPASPPPQPPREKPAVDLKSDIKTYDSSGVKTYEFK